METNEIQLPKELACDFCGKGKSEIKDVKIIILSRPKNTDTQYKRQSKRKKCRAKTAIEPIIGNLKTDFLMRHKYLWKKRFANQAATAWNLKKLMEKLKKTFLQFIFRLFFLENFIFIRYLKNGF